MALANPQCYPHAARLRRRRPVGLLQQPQHRHPGRAHGDPEQPGPGGQRRGVRPSRDPTDPLRRSTRPSAIGAAGAEPFLSEIRLMSFGFAPKLMRRCNGQLLPINQNQALFSLLGTTFVGTGGRTLPSPILVDGRRYRSGFWPC
jgi:tail collar domain